MNKDLAILISFQPDEKAFSRIRQICPGADIRVGPWADDVAVNIPRELVKGAEVLLCETPPANFHQFDQLKWIQLTSHGYAQVLDLPIIERGIRVTIGTGVHDIPIAEWNIMMLLMWHRHMLEMLRKQREKTWDPAARFQAELRGSVVGFCGYGGIARETARIGKAMGLVIWALKYDGTVKKRSLKYCVQDTGDTQGVLPDKVFGPKQKEEFLAGLDYLLVTLPLTPTTRGIIGEKELRMLKSSAVLINPARAHIIEEEAYIECLRQGWIRGSSLDVHYVSPLPAEHPLWSMSNLIMTPHISGENANPHFLSRMYDIFIHNVERYCKGEPLLNELSESQLKEG